MTAAPTCYAATNPSTPAPRDDTKPSSNAPGPNAERPRIVEVHPADGAADVAPDTDLRIRFDRPMSPTLAVLEWDFRGQAGFRLRGPMRYDPDAHEFTLPVTLTPGRKHDVTLNREGRPRGDSYEGFRSTDGLATAPFRWSFTTAMPRPPEGLPAPRASSVSPPSDTEVALLTPVEITFDRPMDPASYGLSTPKPLGPFRDPSLADRVAYDPGARRFTLLLQLPPNWNGELRLEGFRGTDGAEAEPIPLKYRTLREPLAPAFLRRVEQAGDPARLRDLVGRIREASRKVTSVSESVLTTYTFSTDQPGWHDRYWTQGATFSKQGDDKFAAAIDEIMHIPFRVGSDGSTCWFVGSDGRMAVPSRAVDEKNVLLADPFDSRGEADADRLIRERKLDYAGEVDLNGRRCHLIRSWDVSLPSGEVVILGPRWYVDAETLLPVRIEHGDTYAIDYTYSRINEPIPDSEFLPADEPDLLPADPGPLPEGYTRRFLNVIDGTNGRMSVRWGMEGPKGRNSSGLN